MQLMTIKNNHTVPAITFRKDQLHIKHRDESRDVVHGQPRDLDQRAAQVGLTIRTAIDLTCDLADACELACRGIECVNHRRTICGLVCICMSEPRGVADRVIRELLECII